MTKLSYTFIFLFVITSLHSQLLWTVTGKNGKTSYLFGTHHLVSSNYIDSIPGVYQCFKKSNTIISEVAANNQDAQNILLNQVKMPVGKTLYSLLSDDEILKTDQEISKVLKINLQKLNNLKPLFILMMYENEYYKKVFADNEEFQIDSYFQIAGSEQNKTVIGLENISQEMSLLYDSVDIAQQARILVNTVNNTDSLRNSAILIKQLYKKGDLDALLKNGAQETAMGALSDEEVKKYIESQNNEWMKKLPDMMKNNTCFIAIGALHLAGENGIISQLSNAGFKVKPYKSK